MKELNNQVGFKPIGEDMALLFCTSLNERDQITQNALTIGGHLISKITPWKEDTHWLESQ
ncbi:hypothetical protein Syun_014828 [Stephania yunnanensis]|uniref:Uncharacterized protein n=1 Tax=Stephania yunnanensis TaxID=152371 RepID=A0AAP0JLT3_9MAGN